MSFRTSFNSTNEENGKRKIEEDDDYLSMDLEVLEKEYLSQVNEEKKNEKEPYYIKRRKALENQKKKGYNKSAKLIDGDNEKVPLNTPISSSNKGFQLLQKMGFKPGTGLGPSEAGIKEPINLNKNAGSQGLGLEAEKKEKTLMILEAVKKIEQKKQVSFKDNTRQRFLEKQIMKDLYNSRVVCEQLDLSKGIENNELWEPFSKSTEYKGIPSEENEDKRNPIELLLSCDNEKELSKITNYLRNKHYYCLWCGFSYSSFEELSAQCPGDTNEDH